MTFPTLPILHAGGAYPTGWLHSDWRPQPTVILGIFGLIAAYLWLTGPKNRGADGRPLQPVSGGQRTAFVAGSLIALIALSPPLDDWSDYYLLSAHMSQHLLLIFVTVPLWLLGTPAWLLRRLVARPVVNRAGYLLTRPLTAFVLSNAVISFWHTPFAYDAALRHEPLHVVEHLAFIVAAVLGWWPVLGPLPEWPRPAPPLRCLYLFATTIPGGIIGAFVTLAAPGVYTPYVTAPRVFGMGLGTDQEIAGLLMWVLASTIYLVVLSIVFFRWAAGEEAKERRGAGRAAVEPVPGRLADGPGLSG